MWQKFETSMAAIGQKTNDTTSLNMDQFKTFVWYTIGLEKIDESKFNDNKITFGK